MDTIIGPTAICPDYQALKQKVNDKSLRLYCTARKEMLKDAISDIILWFLKTHIVNYFLTRLIICVHLILIY